MSHKQSTLDLLGIKDKNIRLEDDFFAFEDFIVQGEKVTFKIVKAILQSEVNPPCETCNKVTGKWGTKTSYITMPRVTGHPTKLRLKKQRYRCKACNSSFFLSTSIVDKNCFISKATREQVMIEAMDTVSEKNLSKRNDISQSSVSRILNPILFESKKSYNYLPEHLMMDELKVTKGEDGASMSFIYADAKSHKIIDILPDRRLPHLREHFLGFPKEVRDSVKTITIDMYSPYISLIKELFTRARIIIDRFHVVQLLLRALLKTRIQTMNGFSTDSRQYKLFKKYWKHLQKSPRKLNSSQYFYCYNRRCYTTSLDTVEEILEIDSGLYKNYWRVHSLVDAFMDRDKERFYKLLESDTQGLSDYVITAINTLRGYSDYLENSMTYPYSNGPLEGLIRKAKTLARIAYGYRSFERFKNRFLLINNQVFPVIGRSLYYKKAS